MENPVLADVVNLFIQNKYYDAITAIEVLQKQKPENSKIILKLDSLGKKLV